MDILTILGILLGVGVVVLVAVFWRQIKTFVAEAVVELKKVAWPTRKELIDSTWIVLISSAMLGVFIASVDFVLSKFLGLIVR